MNMENSDMTPDDEKNPFQAQDSQENVDEPRQEEPTNRKTGKIKLPPNLGNAVLGGMFLVGIICVIALRMNVGPQKASAEQKAAELQVDSAISRLDSAASNASENTEADNLLETFYYEAKQRQIPARRLKGNPFVFEPPEKKEEKKEASDQEKADPSAPKDVQKGQRRDWALSQVHQLSLQSILMGPSEPMAMISNNLLAKGQTIRGWTVSEINSRRVVLTWKEETYTLEMPE